MSDNADRKISSKKSSVLRTIRSILIKLLVITVVFYLVFTFLFGVFRMEGNRMYPAFKDGDLCITYRLDEYHSSDVVAYRTDDGIQFGRIIARAGDVVDGDESGVLINGLHPAEEIFYPTDMSNSVIEFPYELSEGEFVVLNDYRSDFRDSRLYGVITKDMLEGKIIFIFRRRGF